MECKQNFSHTNDCNNVVLHTPTKFILRLLRSWEIALTMINWNTYGANILRILTKW